MLTLPDGSKRRFNPFQIMGWREAEVPHGGQPGRSIMGTSVIMPGGPVGVIESESTVDWLFCLATGERGPSDVAFAVGAPETTASVEAPIPAPARARRSK